MSTLLNNGYKQAEKYISVFWASYIEFMFEAPYVSNTIIGC